MAAAAVLSLLLFYPRQTSDRQVPSLLSRPIRFDAALIERAWNGIASRADLKKLIFRDRVNRYFPSQAIQCRVKYKTISYQALLAPAGSRLELDLKTNEGIQLTFSLFNPQPEKLRFLVKMASSGKETLLFSRSIREKMGKVENIFLPRTKGKTVRLILETRGSGLGAWINPCQLQNHPRPRTVLILMLDTLRADHVSAYGYRRSTTPALDELAKGSLMFSRAFSTSSWTLPAHVSLFSGRDVLAHGVVAPKSLIPSEVPLLAEKMQQKGFITLALTGGGFVNDQYGFYRGFQKYVNRSSDIFRRSAAGLMLRAFQDKVAEFADQDLFIFLHTFQIHAPYKAPDSYYRAFNPILDIKIKHIGGHLRLPRKSSTELPPAESADRQKLIDLYDASILYSDQELLKPLLAYLRSSNRFNDAMVIVLSDHGEEFYDHGDWEHGHTLYQELTRIPLIIKLPQQKRGEIREKLFAISDIPGLILAEYGLDAEGSDFINGRPNDPRRVLELSLPVIPLRQGLFGRVSYVDHDHQYIHNFLPAATAGNELSPTPHLKSDEWFTLGDIPLAAAEPFSPSPALHSHYKKKLADYLRRLKALKRNEGQLDAELLNKLRALGYLNN